MLYSVAGKLTLKSDHFAVVTAAGLGIKLFASKQTLKALPAVGADVKFFTHLYVREDTLDLYGFLSAEEMNFFEMLISVSGIGPKSALSILDIAPLGELSAAIKEGRPDLLTRASGVGRKTAERVIVELRGKVESARSGLVVEKMEGDADIVEALTSLGYRREEARAALGKVDPKVRGMEERLRAALGALGKK
ncbi:MAG: Holliday junction branch migration protein RuvA [Minisyncoccia bacterium]|jgi:Holliday junction DNA helicase RuvA